MAKRRLIDCIFCGGIQVPQSKEHAIPQWLVSKLGHYAMERNQGREPKFVEHRYDDLGLFKDDARAADFGANAIGRPTPRGAGPYSDQTQNVCEECNRGWMSRLEDSVKPIIGGFLEGKQKLLHPWDQTVLAMWVAKTCIAIDAVYDDPLIPPQYGSRHLYTFGLTPPTYHVTLAHAINFNPEGGRIEARQPLHERTAERRVGAVFFAFQFDHLIVRCMVNLFNPIFEVGQTAQIAIHPEHEVEIWPRREPILWPRDSSLSATRLAQEAMAETTTEVPPAES